MSSKIYCGTGRIISTNYGNMPKIKLHKDDINTIVKWMRSNDSDWVNIDMKEKQSPVDGKPTHYLEVDEWKPPEVNPSEQEFKANQVDNTSDDLPF